MNASLISNFSRKAAIVVASVLCIAPVAQGFTLQPGLGALTDKDGNDIAADSLVIIVVDLSGDGVSHPTTDAFTPGPDDFVLGALGAKPFTGLGTLASGVVNGDIGFTLSDGITIDSGDSVSLFWFPELTATNFLSDSDANGNGFDDDLDMSMTPGDTTFGAYNTTGSLPSGGSLDPSWVVPDGNGDTVPISGVGVGIGGTIPDYLLAAAFKTSTAAIPEPSSAILALFGCSFLLLRRRK
ncbi:MAG: PEP-CTERM sorting domain-containing protein [Verrucomicrobiaceae bacterium]|nr:PEP-CTERM sorting domain-containing protein [Verrucomicrobiaceae bacterium]NCF91334.1 PEP-CTERM sorting domain-containing protein [Verrucomicrobiaceae bacterium]